MRGGISWIRAGIVWDFEFLNNIKLFVKIINILKIRQKIKQEGELWRGKNVCDTCEKEILFLKIQNYFLKSETGR